MLPFERRHSIGPETPRGDLEALAVMFTGLALLWQAIGRQERPDRVDIPPTKEEVRALQAHATLAFPGAPRPLMVPWLRRYLRDRRGADWATVDHFLPVAGDR